MFVIELHAAAALFTSLAASAASGSRATRRFSAVQQKDRTSLCGLMLLANYYALCEFPNCYTRYVFGSMSLGPHVAAKCSRLCSYSLIHSPPRSADCCSASTISSEASVLAGGQTSMASSFRIAFVKLRSSP